ACRRRHRRIGFVEADLSAGAGEVAGNDVAHLGAHALLLIAAQGADVAAGDGDGRDYVRLAGCLAAYVRSVQLGGRAADDEPDIVGEVRLGKRAAAIVEDAGELVDGA